MSEQLNKTYQTEHDARWGELRYATYHWGDVTLSEYEHVIFRGKKYITYTDDEPNVGGREHSHPDAVAELASIDEGTAPELLDAREVCEYWATRQPGEILWLEVTDKGALFAAVWSGKVSATNSRHDIAYTAPPQELLENWESVVLNLNGDVVARHYACISLVGPVGTVADLQYLSGDSKGDGDILDWMWGDTDDRNPFESEMPDWMRDDTAPDADVWGDFIAGLNLE